MTTTATIRREEGFAMLVIMALMVPLLIAAAAFTSVMSSRHSELQVELDEELALLAAESGVDQAMFNGRTGSLVHDTPFTRTLGDSHSFRVEPTHLLVDGQDNDGDTAIDEADEDVFQILVIGRYRETKRRVVAYLGPVPLLPEIRAAFTTQDADISIDLAGAPLISGKDLNMSSTPGTGADVHGFAVATPGTVTHLQSELSPTEETQIVGAGSTPSLIALAPTDIADLAARLENVADLVLTNGTCTDFEFGNGPAGTANITYRSGDVDFDGTSRGAGILIVTGHLRMSGNFRFDGVVIVLGEVLNPAGTAAIYGAILQGPVGNAVATNGTLSVHYSTAAIDLANSISGRYVAFNGWQEITR